MKKYKEIHIWHFPPTLTFVALDEKFRSDFFKKLIKNSGSQQTLVDDINKWSLKYGIKRSYTRLALYGWIKGNKLDNGKIKTVNLPLWLLIESSKKLSKVNSSKNLIMLEIENNIKSYSIFGNSNPITKPKFPLYLTPEMVSVIFHFVGDGHIGRKGVSSSYRQMNKEALTNFLIKLKNIFGDFDYSKNEFKNGKLVIPKIITEFYKYYFDLPNTNTFKAYIPLNIKSLKKEFLVAGLVSFIIDDGYIGDVVTFYSKNRRLLEDLKGVASTCGYICYPIREKFSKGKVDIYRFNISIKSFQKFHRDIDELLILFPTCSLVHKQERLIRKLDN